MMLKARVVDTLDWRLGVVIKKRMREKKSMRKTLKVAGNIIFLLIDGDFLVDVVRDNSSSYTLLICL